jgi:uroporphyrinogen-III synthase
VESFFSINKPSAGTILFAIGKTTADRIRHFTNNTVVESDFPGKENLVEKAISYLDTSNQQNEHIKK